MFYYESDSDDELLYGGYMNEYDAPYNHWDLFDSDYGEYGHDFFSDSDDYSYGLGYESGNNCFEGCRSPSLFPDKCKFSSYHVTRMRCMTENLQALPRITDTNIIERLDKTPCLELLWENLLYLKELTSIGIARTTLQDTSTATSIIYNKSIDHWKRLPSEIHETANQWFVWCNDLLIETLQKVVPFRLPYTAWNCIINNLKTGDVENDKPLLTSNLQTVSGDSDKPQIIERIFMESIIKDVNEICGGIFMLLFSATSSDLEINHLVHCVTKYFNIFNSKFPRFCSFLEDEGPNYTSLYFTPNLSYTGYIDDLCESAGGCSYNEVDMCKMITGQLYCPYNSTHHSILVESHVSNNYDLFCFEKNSLGSQRSTFGVTIPCCLEADSPPTLFESGRFVATLHKEDENSNHCVFKVWEPAAYDIEVSDDPHLVLNTSELCEMVGKSDSDAITSTITNAAVVNGNQKEIILAISLTISDKDTEKKFEYMSIMSFGRANDGTYQARPSWSYSMPDARLYALHSSFLFSLHLGQSGEETLSIHDACQPSMIINEIPWSKDWKIKFNNKSDDNTCLIYSKECLQIRKLDVDFSLIKTLELNFNCSSMNEADVEYSVHGSIAYGHIIHHPLDIIFEHHSEETKHSLQKLFTGADQHLLVDLGSCNPDPVYFNSQSCENSLGESDQEEIKMCSEVLELKHQFSGFDSNGDLVITRMSGDFEWEEMPEDCLNPCFTDISISTFKMHESYSSMIGIYSEKAGVIFNFYIREKIKREETRKRQKEQYEKARKVEEKAEREAEARNIKNMERRKKQATRRLQSHLERKENQPPIPATRPAENLNSSVQDAISQKQIFVSVIHAWFQDRHYGFTSVQIGGKNQDVFISESCVPKRKGNVFRTGARIKFCLRWDYNKPRPRAIDASLVD